MLRVSTANGVLSNVCIERQMLSMPVYTIIQIGYEFLNRSDYTEMFVKTTPVPRYYCHP